MRTILIDGYNVIGADPNLSRLLGQSLEAARTALLQTIAGSPRFRGDAVTVVFDGAQTSTLSASRLGHVSAVYSPAGTSADDVIKERAASAPTPEQVVVVTDDADIRDHCRRHGCSVTGSQNLLDQLTLPGKLRRPRPVPDTDFSGAPNPSGTKRGNARRLPKRARRPPSDYRF